MEQEDDVRTPIREELSKMSFEELQQLKERLGAKVYNEAMFGESSRRKRTSTNFKRVNKNRPLEMSSKIRSSRREIKTSIKNAPRDPRFDSLCGEFNKKSFKKSYSFLNDIRDREIGELKTELQTEEDEERKEKIQYLLQRMENQTREEMKRKKKEEKKNEEQQAKVEALRQGEKPQFRNKSEKRVIDLVEQYEDLKKKGKLQKHIEKQRKKNATKDRKRIEQDGALNI